MHADRRELLFTAGAFAGGTLLSCRAPAAGFLVPRQATLPAPEPPGGQTNGSGGQHGVGPVFGHHEVGAEGVSRAPTSR